MNLNSSYSFFFQEVYQLFDIYLLSSFDEDVVGDIVNKLDPNGTYIKNIILINQFSDEEIIQALESNDLMGDSTVILKATNDNSIPRTNKEIQVPPYEDNKSQCTNLSEVIPILKNIVQLKITNIEEYVQDLRDKMIMNVTKGSLTPFLHFMNNEN